jgi:hypothetical protein
VTPDIASFLVGLFLGAALLWWARGETIRVLREQLKQAREAEVVATDRLVNAWKEGEKVLPRPEEAPPPPEPLPADLQAELDQWEDVEHRVMLEAAMRDGMRRGLSTVAILLELDNMHP